MGFLGCDITNSRCLLSVTIRKPSPEGKAATIIGADQFGTVSTVPDSLRMTGGKCDLCLSVRIPMKSATDSNRM